MREATKVPPRRTWAKTVMESTTQATNHARRCPRRMPRAIMIIAMPATAVKRGRRLGDAEGEDRLDLVETTAQRRCRGDDDVDESVEEQAVRSPRRRTVRCRRCSFRRSMVTGKGLPVGHEPTVAVALGGRRLHVGVRDELFK